MRLARRVPRWSAARRARPRRERMATFVCVARAGPRWARQKTYAPCGAPPPFIYLGRLDGLSCSVQQTSDAIAASRERWRASAPTIVGEGDHPKGGGGGF